ncbi:MAG: hypothetical protein ACEQSB_03565 [Undibacterium sp.]
MAETVSFIALTRDAVRNVLLGRSLLWFALPIGVLIASTSYSAARAETILNGKGLETFFSFLSDGADGTFLLFLTLSIALTFTQAPLRGLIILSLQSSYSKAGNLDQNPPQRKDYLRALRIATLFELGFWLLITILCCLLLAPSFLAWQMNREAFPFVSQTGLILLISITLYLYLVKELSLLYGLLGNLSLRSSLDLGFRIFRRHALLTLLYFMYLSILSLLGTICIAAMSHALLLLFKIEGVGFSEYIFSLPFFGLYFIFDQALRLVYFRKIATSPKSRSPKIPTVESTEPVTGMTNI